MEKLKFALFSVVTLGLLGIFGYWAVASIQSGTEHAKEQKIEALEKENTELKKEAEKLESGLGTAQARLAELEKPAPVEEKPSTPTTYKYQTLIDELQKLVDGKVFLKEKSIGAKVGTVQKFLNIYNSTSLKIDNSYGAGTSKEVEDFQRDMGLTADGDAGPTTFTKMIEWLKKQ